ncbi:MAG: hypothetical protein HC902_01765 [Calothrix sp. SM1_5_4]|nr:hypothetical protein [Calothrix sp. SM1_5_4]
MSGSIAAFKACQVISRLTQEGSDVQVIATDSLSRFIGPATLEGLTGRKPLVDLWEGGHAMDHIHLTRWADAAVLCPASANTLARLAHGLADDMVSATALAWPIADKPFHIFPAMNTQMLRAPATQANLRLLSERGFRITPGRPRGPWPAAIQARGVCPNLTTSWRVCGSLSPHPARADCSSPGARRGSRSMEFVLYRTSAQARRRRP